MEAWKQALCYESYMYIYVHEELTNKHGHVLTMHVKYIHSCTIMESSLTCTCTYICNCKVFELYSQVYIVN